LALYAFQGTADSSGFAPLSLGGEGKFFKIPPPPTPPIEEGRKTAIFRLRALTL